MTTLIGAMLETARLMGVVTEGTATGGSTTTLVDTGLDHPAGYFEGGTLWALSGNNSGLCQKVTSFMEGTLTFGTTLSTPIASGDNYAVATPEFPKYKLKQAVLHVLRFSPILKTDDTTVVTADTEEYALPTGVSNIKRIEAAAESSAPYNFVPLYSWRERNGKVIFNPAPSNTGNILRIWYEGAHGEIAESGTILDSVDINWLKWSAAAFLYRDSITRIKKDDPVRVDLLNEAKLMEETAIRTARRFQLQTMPSDPKIAIW